MFRIKFNSIMCTKTSSMLTGDDVFLNINGTTVWGNYSINNGQTIDLSTQAAAKSIDFVTPLKLELYDYNTFSSNTLIGTAEVVANSYGNGAQSVVFNTSGNYTLNYEIISDFFLKFLDLKCIKTDGYFTDDQVYLLINNNKIWGNYKMNNGDSVDLRSQPVVEFAGPVITLQLYDHDMIGSDDFLGQNNVSTTLGQQKLSFTGDGANYELTVEVHLPPEYLATTITSVVGYPAPGNLKATRQNLGLVNTSINIHIDIAGEGYRQEGTVISGFKAAINVNTSDVTTTMPPYTKIPSLVKIASWDNEFPFDNNYADYVTMQGAPLTDLNVQHIASIVAKNGEIGLWIDRGSYQSNIDKLAKLVNATGVDYNPFDESAKSGYPKIRIVANKP